MDKKDLATVLVSVYAVLVSTLSLIWNIALSLRDKGKVKIGGFFGHLVGDIYPAKKVLYFEFVNIGRRPILVTGFGGNFKRRFIKEGASSFIINTPNLPVKLEPGDRFQIHFDTFDAVDEKAKNMFAFDSYGKNHKISKKLLKSLVKQKKDFILSSS